MATISTSTSRTAVLVLGLLVFMGSAAGYYYGDTGNSIIQGDTGFSIPQYDSQGEILANLVAPFIVIAVILQIGLYRALLFTLADNGNHNALVGDPYEKERSRVRKQAMILAIFITAMLIPSPLWGFVTTAIESLTLIAVGGLAILFLMFFYYALKPS